MDHYISIDSEDLTKIHTTTICKHDAWGEVHEWEVEWMSELVRHIDPAMENVDLAPVAWGADDCPVRAELNHDGSVVLRRNIRSVCGMTGSVIMRPLRRGEDEDLVPGTFRVREVARDRG